MITSATATSRPAVVTGSGRRPPEGVSEGGDVCVRGVSLGVEDDERSEPAGCNRGADDVGGDPARQPGPRQTRASVAALNAADPDGIGPRINGPRRSCAGESSAAP